MARLRELMPDLRISNPKEFFPLRQPAVTEGLRKRGFRNDSRNSGGSIGFWHASDIASARLVECNGEAAAWVSDRK